MFMYMFIRTASLRVLKHLCYMITYLMMTCPKYITSHPQTSVMVLAMQMCHLLFFVLCLYSHISQFSVFVCMWMH